MSEEYTYKETNKDWLGTIPSKWQLKRVGQFFSERLEKVDDQSYPPLSVTKSGVVDQLKYVAKTNDGDNRKLVRQNDFVINSRSDRKGSSGVAKRDGSVSLINIVLEPRIIEPKFIEYLFKSYYFKEEFFRNGKGIHWDLWTTRWEQLKNILIPIPSNLEQKNIYQYLDKKTKKIGELILKIEKKIEHLKEYKNTFINQYITKGLDNNVEMKDSGIDWIGQIPKHWYMSRIKFHGDILIGLSFDKDEVNNSGIGTLVLRSSNVQNGKIALKDNVWVKKDIPKKLRVQKDDILICSRNGSRKLIGKNCLLERELEGMTWGVFMTVLRSSSPRFLYWILNSQIFKSQSGLYLTSTINQLTVSTLENMIIPYTSDLDEQNKIDQFLTKETEKINQVLNKEEKRISLLKEYRDSLISSVVTGKIRITEDMI